MISFGNSQCLGEGAARCLAVSRVAILENRTSQPRSRGNMPMARCVRRTSRWNRSSRWGVRMRETEVCGKSPVTEQTVWSTAGKT